MANPQFSDLTTLPTQQQVLDQEVIPQLQAQPQGLQVTSWVLGGVYRTLAMMVAYVRVQARQFIAAFTLAGFEAFVFGRQPTPNGQDVTGWSAMTALNRYGLAQKPATYTLRNITLTNSGGTPYNNLQEGSITIQFPSGNRYLLRGGKTSLIAPVAASDTSLTVGSTIGFPATGTLVIDSEQISYSGTTITSFTGLTRGANGTTAAAHLLNTNVGQVMSIPANSSVQLAFRSEQPMAIGLSYNSDPVSSTLQMVTSQFAGVTASNPSTTFSPVSQVGSGVGLVTPGGSPSSNHQVTVRIDASGTVAGSTVAWSTSLDGGTFVSQTGSTVVNLGGTSINITLSDNGGSFAQGAYYYFSTPGSDLIAPGAAIETPQSLGARCAGLWALLPALYDQNGNYVPPASPTQNAYQALALSLNLSVVIAFVQVDPVINNLLHLYLAGQGGASLPGSILAAEQASFNVFNMTTDQIVCQTPTGRPITLALTGAGAGIQCRTSQLVAAKAALNQRLQAYFGGTDPNATLGINGLIDYDYVLSLIRTTPGVTHVSGTLQITANAVNYTSDVQLPSMANAVEVAQWTQDAGVAFPWLTSN